LAWAIDLRNAGLWQEALAFLEDMRLRRIDPDAYAYNNVAWQLEQRGSRLEQKTM
jgi:pentatricopeptide repeat protein